MPPKPVRKTILFYFSGTGNSKQIASWFSKSAAFKSIDCQTYDIDKTDLHALPPISDDTLIGFISPIHGFNYPPKVLRFLRLFPKGRNRFFLMNTRGGIRIGNHITPGLTGIAFLLSSFWLRRKGYKITGWIPFDMPSNWISFHPALSKESSTYIHHQMKLKVEKHADKLLSGQTDFVACRDLLQDILISPVSLAYYYAGRFFLAKSFYATATCNNCGLCEKACPVNAITNSTDHPFWTFKCESCMRCMNTCPQRAIETTHGLWAILILLSSFLSGFCYLFLNPDTPSGLLKFVLFNLILFTILGVCYRLQHLLLKNKLIRKLIPYTSLTHYKWWGRFYNALRL